MAQEKRKGEAQSPRAYQQAVRKRLNELRSRYPQSEIARRTKTPLTNVHRYMNTGKIPAEFCAALVEAFEVNPAWLLAGAGGALLTEVNTGAAKVGSEMLTMVEAMDAVSRVRLGALAGKQQEQTLRELGDSIGAYERLRERMNQQTRPVLEHLLQRFGELCTQMQLERAGNVRRACQQVAKFCDDEDLLWQFDNQQAMHEHLSGRVDGALQIHLRLFARKLREGVLRDHDACAQAGSLSLALRDSGRFIEGRRICRAAMELSADEVKPTYGYQDLVIIAGSYDVELGDLHNGLAQIQRIYSAIPPDNLSFATIMLLRAELLAGLCTLADARARSFPSRGRSRILLRHAALLEEAAELRKCRDHGVGQHESQILPAEYEARRCALLQSALDKPRANLVAQFDQAVAEAPPGVNSPQLRAILLAIQRAQLARLAGANKVAVDSTMESRRLIDALPRELTVTIDLQAIHARNVIKLLDDNAAVSRARDYLASMTRNGYAALRT